MKITKAELKKLIKEEVKLLNENWREHGVKFWDKKRKKIVWVSFGWKEGDDYAVANAQLRDNSNVFKVYTVKWDRFYPGYRDQIEQEINKDEAFWLRRA